MVTIYLILSALGVALFPTTVYAQERPILARADSLSIEVAVLEIQAEAEEQRLEKREKRKEEWKKLITSIVVSVTKGVAIVISILILRSIIGRIGRGVAEKRHMAGLTIKAEPFILFVTVESGEEAATIGRHLVEERLAVCANIVPGLRSISPFQGQIQDKEKLLMLIKTTRPRLKALTRRVWELHSADTPEIITIPIHRGHKPYLEWIEENTRPASLWKSSRRSAQKKG